MRNTRDILAILLLLGGTIWSVPMQPGRDDVEPDPAAYSATDPAEFEVTSFRGTLDLTGHTSSRRHENRLREAAAENFAEQAVQFEFRALGVAPDWWDDATVALLASLTSMESPSAYLNHDRLRIRAIVDDEPVASARLQSLHRILPPGFTVDIQLTEVDKSTSANSLCQRQFAVLKPGSVGFAESGTEMRAAAYPVLDRIIALADACRDSTISITGHTDSTGNEAWNRHLSFARAQAVATHLEDGGIDAQRLIVTGAGSSFPVGDNATRYGRSLNRRIEIKLESTTP